jgi:hypothetical protein
MQQLKEYIVYVSECLFKIMLIRSYPKWNLLPVNARESADAGTLPVKN